MMPGQYDEEEIEESIHEDCVEESSQVCPTQSDRNLQTYKQNSH